VELKDLKVLSEILNGKSLRRIQIHSRLFLIALSLIVIGKLSASVIRIDGGFEDWKDVKVCAYDPRGDAKGAFDITKVYAASQGSILYLRFDTTNILNLQNGPEAEGTLLVILNSELLNRTERRQLKLAVADSKLSDHLLITVDFQFSDNQEN